MKKDPEIRDEEILLMGLCRLEFSAELSERIRSLAVKVSDWDYFTRLAGEHGVSALVSENLDKLKISGLLPAGNAETLRNAAMISLSRNAFHLSATEELLGLLNKEDIKVVLLKGLALEMTVYGNRGLRQMTDVDILVRKEDYLKAQGLMRENGYDQLPVKSGFHRPIAAWTGKHLPSLLKNGTSADLHIELFGGKKNTLTRELIDRSEQIMIDRQRAFIPDPRLFFLFLVKHLYQHEMNGESQLRLYADLVVLIEKYRDKIICYELLDDASKAGLTKVLAWKLEPLRDLWGLKFPGWIDDFIDRWFVPESINRFVLFLKSPKNNKPLTPGRLYRQNLSEIPGLHRKLLFLLGDLFPTFTFMKERYGLKSKLAVLLHYPLRAGKIFWLFRK